MMRLREIAVVAGYALREHARRKVFAAVLALSVVFVLLYWLGVHTLVARQEANLHTPDRGTGIDVATIVAAHLLGAALFCIQFLGASLAIFLTLGAIGGDAERGLLQQIVVRPLGRGSVVLGRALAAVVVCSGYVVVMYVLTTAIVGNLVGWWPDHPVQAGALIGVSPIVVAGLSMLGSVLMSSVANGIAMFMLFGGGLLAGLLGQLGGALHSTSLTHWSRVAAWILPFESLFQWSLDRLTAETTGTARLIIQLGPLGGAHAGGAGFLVYAAAYVVGCLVLAIAVFHRRDL